MSGPPYPHPSPAPGSNAIGSFTIGVSPIGTISSFDTWATVINQYGKSPTIDALLSSFSAAVDMTESFDNFYDWMWDVQTAQGYGLDVWGRIVGVTRVLELPGSVAYFGFQEANSWVGFNQAPFFSGGSFNNNFSLQDADFRTLIFAKAASNISDGSILSINAILLGLFPNRGDCYVTDGENMTMTYTFAFPLTPIDLAIVEQSGVLPKPTGVLATVVQP